MVDIAQGYAGLGQAIADGFAGKTAPVLDAAKSLFFHRCDQLAVLHQAGSGIGVIGVEAENVGHADRSDIGRKLRLCGWYR
jgi:hypothetical protein